MFEFAPENISAAVLSSTAVLVEWSPLNDVEFPDNFTTSGDFTTSDDSDIVTGYSIYYHADGESLRRRYDVNDVDVNNATLTGLRPFTYYTITMDAATERSLSVERPDPPLRVRTEEDGQINYLHFLFQD